jgi:hypothetical protein
MSFPLLEYVWIPSASDVPDVQTYLAAVKESEWMNLGKQTSKNYGNGNKEVFMFIGIYAQAGLKFLRSQTELSNDCVLFNHCRQIGRRVVVRPIKTTYLACSFKPAWKQALFACKYWYALSGNVIGEINVDRYTTMGGLQSLLISAMRKAFILSPQTCISLIFQMDDERLMAAFKLTMSVLVGNLMAAFKLTMSVLDGSVGQHLMAAFELTMSIGFRLTPFRG